MISNHPREHCELIGFNEHNWWWPKLDNKLKLVNDWVLDIDVALKFLPRTGQKLTVIQAGGACGVWPWYLSKYFSEVMTYEPDPINFWCLYQNTTDRYLGERISGFQAALGETEGYVKTKLPSSEDNNVGAYYTMEVDDKDSTPRFMIDKIFAADKNLDFLCLDIEGREIEALKGATQTIARCRPIIMIEEKSLPQMGKGKDVEHNSGEATQWLIDTYQYKVVDRVHRDVIMAP